MYFPLPLEMHFSLFAGWSLKNLNYTVKKNGRKPGSKKSTLANCCWKLLCVLEVGHDAGSAYPEGRWLSCSYALLAAHPTCLLLRIIPNQQNTEEVIKPMLNTGTKPRRNTLHYKVNGAKWVSSLYYKKITRNTFSLKQKSMESQQTVTADILFFSSRSQGQHTWSGITQVTHGGMHSLWEQGKQIPVSSKDTHCCYFMNRW